MMSNVMLSFHPIRALASGLLGAALLLTTACQATLEDRLAEARAMQDVGEFEQSMEPLQELLKSAPDHAEANLRLGLALLRTNQANRAIWPLQRAAETAEFAARANLHLAQLYFGNNDYESAVNSLDRVLAEKQDNVTALSLRYKAYLDWKRQEKAIEDLDRLRELAPEELEFVFARAVTLAELERLEEAEAGYRRFVTLTEASGEAGMAATACASLAVFFRDDVKDLARAEEQLLVCDEKYPDDPSVQGYLLEMYDEGDRDEEALALVRNSFEANPDDLSRRVRLANRLRNNGEKEEAHALMEEAVATGGGVAARLALARFYQREDDAEGALAALEAAFEEVGGVRSEEARFYYADALVEAGQIQRAQEIAGELEDPIYRQMIEGRLQFAGGDYAAALQTFEAAVSGWPDNPGARYLAGYSAYRIGEFDKALAHLREAVRIKGNANDAGLLAARLYLERGSFGEAARFARSFVKGRGKQRAEGYVIWARALDKDGNPEGAENALDALDRAGFPLEATVERAALARAHGQPGAAVGIIETSGLDLKDPANEAALRALVDYLTAQGRGVEATARVEAAMQAHPDSATLMELRGTLQLALGEHEAARQTLERALAAAPENARALTGLGTLAALEGRTADAIQLLDQASRADPENPAPAYAAAQLALATGRTEDAEQRLRAVVRTSIGHAGSRNDLAWMLASDKRQLGLALILAQDAARIDPQPAILDTLGYVHLQRGELRQAVRVFEQALAAEPDAPSIRYRLGLALAGQGDTQGAAEAFRKALAARSFPEAEAARHELALLEQP